MDPDLTKPTKFCSACGTDTTSSKTPKKGRRLLSSPCNSKEFSLLCTIVEELLDGTGELIDKDRVRNMKNRLSQNSSMKIPILYTCGGKPKTKIITHKILPLKSCSSLKFPQTVISIIFLYLTEKQPSEILRLLLKIQTRWFDVCCTVKY